MHYIINVGDAWFAQIPREGNIYARANNLHDTATRCTACHPSSFSTESNLVAHRNGYPIRSKSNMQYVIDRIANSVTPLYGDRRPLLATVHRHPPPGARQAGGDPGGLRARRLGEGNGGLRAVRPVPQGRLGAGGPTSPTTRSTASSRATASSASPGATGEVLTEMARRTGRDDYQARRPKSIARISNGSRPTDLRAETLQDRIHRLYAWWLIDKEKFAEQDQARDGGPARPPECRTAAGTRPIPRQPGPSAVYTTGQIRVHAAPDRA